MKLKINCLTIRIIFFFFRIHNPPPPGLDRNSPVNASSDEGMHPPESTHHHLHHQMDKFDNQTTTLQPMMRTGYPTSMLVLFNAVYSHINLVH